MYILDELFPNEQSSQRKDRGEIKIDLTRKVSILDADSTTSMTISSSEEKSRKSMSPKPKEHTRIIFDLNDKSKRKSVLERLGKRQADIEHDNTEVKMDERKLKLIPVDNKKDEHPSSGSKRKIFADKQNTTNTKSSDKKKYDWNKNEKADAIEQEKREVSY